MTIEISTLITFHKITYNTIILARRAIKFLVLNSLYSSKVLAFLDYIMSLAKARDKLKSKKNLRDIEKISVQKL